ncbi:MAG TPA: DNA alkylation repair protein [Anaerolineales bacterium]|nr:DNA alkylation repair protein [Anaerolineales bacterium]
MKSQDARALGESICNLIARGHVADAYALLSPVLAERISFRLLDVIGEQIGAVSLESANPFLEHIAAQNTMGGWVVVASALKGQLERDLPGVFARCHNYVILADIWYATDILGERVPGPALVTDFDRAFAALAPWRADENRWVRRTVGVAVHLWAKRSRGADEYSKQVKQLLTFLEPMFEERDIDAIKGVGWGLKTLGKYYPDLIGDWLTQQKNRPHRVLMMRKAITYLSKKQRALIGK